MPLYELFLQVNLTMVHPTGGPRYTKYPAVKAGHKRNFLGVSEKNKSFSKSFWFWLSQIRVVFGEQKNCSFFNAFIQTICRSFESKAGENDRLRFKSPVFGFQKNGHFTRPLSFRASAVLPRVPVSAGLSTLDTWNHSSIVVDSKISENRLATNTGNLLVEFNTAVQ